MTAERQPMTRARHPEREMHLPEGSTCADCRHFARCKAMFGHIAADEVCDWSPSRFSPFERAAAEAAVMKDAEAGLAWWDALDDAGRNFWMLASMGNSPADAWHYFKRCGAAGLVPAGLPSTRSSS